MTAQSRSLLLAGMLMAVVIVVWLPVLDTGFQFDDWSVIARDPRVASLAAWWAAMPAIRPLLKLEYALGHELGGAPLLYRSFNLALHALNTALVFGLTRRLARRMRTADPLGATQIGACTAVIFALHPVQTEAVTYLSGGSLVFMTTCALCCLACFLRGTDGVRPAPWFAAALVALLAALCVRETAVVLPLACALWWGAENGQRQRVPWLPLLLLTAATGAAVVAGLWWTAYPWLLETSLAIRSPLHNLVAQGESIAWLLGQLVRWDRLNADPALVADAGLTWIALTRVLLLAAILVAAAWQWRSRRWLAFGVLWFFLWLAPTNSLLARLDLVNERQLHLALLGPAWLAAQGLQRLRGQGLAVVALLAMLLAGATALRNRVYLSEVSFWQDVTVKSPQNARAANNLGVALAVSCQPLAAARAFDNAIRLAPDDARAQVNLELLTRGELPDVPASCVTAPNAPR